MELLSCYRIVSGLADIDTEGIFGTMKSPLITFALTACLALTQVGCSTVPDQTHGLLGLVTLFDQAEPINTRQLSHFLKFEPKCSYYSKSKSVNCDSHDFYVDDVKVDSLDYRMSIFGSFLRLNLRELPCIDVDIFDRHFGHGVDVSGCTDGVVCIYRRYDRKWGRLSLGVGSDWSKTNCVKSVIFDARPT